MSEFVSFIFLGIMVSISFIIPQPTHAATLYDNGPSTHSGGSSICQFIAADDFVFDTNVMISGASVDVSDGPASENRRWDGTVESHSARYDTPRVERKHQPRDTVAAESQDGRGSSLIGNK